MSKKHVFIVNFNAVLNMTAKSVAMMSICAAEYMHLLINLKSAVTEYCVHFYASLCVLYCTRQSWLLPSVFCFLSAQMSIQSKFIDLVKDYSLQQFWLLAN